MANTGALRYNTAFHSTQLRGVMANSDCVNAHEHARSQTDIRGRTHCEEGDIQDPDMESHAQCDRPDEEEVLPERKPQQTLVLRQRVHRVEHLDGDEDRQAHRRRPLRHLVREHLAADLREQARALVEVGLRSAPG